MRRRRKAQPPPPRRSYVPREKLLVAFLAGCGQSDVEIAEGIGGTTANRIAAMLSSWHLPRLRRSPRQKVVQFSVRRQTLAVFAKLAQPRHTDAPLLMGHLLDICATDEALLLNLLDEEGAH